VLTGYVLEQERTGPAAADAQHRRHRRAPGLAQPGSAPMGLTRP
jgi:hypothetical protein